MPPKEDDEEEDKGEEEVGLEDTVEDSLAVDIKAAAAGGGGGAAVEDEGGTIDGDGSIVERQPPLDPNKPKSLEEQELELPWYKQIWKVIVRVIQDPQTLILNAKQSVKDSLGDLQDSLLEYGPPYSEDYGGDLFLEVNDVKANPLSVHVLLVCGANPNLGDPEDSNTTPIHFAAYHVHLKIMKMLKRAGGNMDIENQLGQRPLGFACLHNHKNREEEEIKFLDFLFEEGVQINHTDKAGYRAIDYAAMNGNVAVVTWLLQHGAKVLRTNDFLWIPKHDLLEEISNIMVKEMIRARIEEEEKAHDVKLRRINEIKAKAIREERSRKATAKLNAKLENARAEEREMKRQQELVLMDNERKKQAMLDQRKKRQWMENRQYQLARWEKRTSGRGWLYQKRDIKVACGPQTDELINTSKELLQEIEQRKKDDRIPLRWKEITGTEKGQAFRSQEEEEAEENKRKAKLAQLNRHLTSAPVTRKKGKRRFSRPAPPVINPAAGAGSGNNR